MINTIDESAEARNRLETFKNICTDMYESSNLMEFSKNGKIVYGKGYAEVILMVMKTKHRYLLNMNGLTLDEIGFLLNTTRERIRQIEEDILGSKPNPRKQSKRKERVGKIRTPSLYNGYSSVSDKISKLKDLRETLKLMF